MKTIIAQYDCPDCDGSGETGGWASRKCRGCNGTGKTATDGGHVVEAFCEIIDGQKKYWRPRRIYGKSDHKMIYKGAFPTVSTPAPIESDLTKLFDRDQTDDDFATVYYLDEFPDQIVADRGEAERRLGTLGETPRGRLKYNPDAFIVEQRVTDADGYVTLPPLKFNYPDEPQPAVKGKVEKNFEGWSGFSSIQHTRRNGDGALYGLVLRGLTRKYRTSRYEARPKSFKSRAEKIRNFLDNPPDWRSKPNGRYVVRQGVTDWQVWIVKQDDDGRWTGIKKLPFESVPADILRAVGHDEVSRHHTPADKQFSELKFPF